MFAYQLKAKVKLDDGRKYPKGAIVSAHILDKIMNEYHWITVKILRVH